MKMKITDITWEVVRIPLNTVFKTALRTVTTMENVLVRVHTDTEHIGYGSAAPTTVITGETTGSICSAVEFLGDQLRGMDIGSYVRILEKLNRCMSGNGSAKAAVDMAVYDLVGKMYCVPLHSFLGGAVRRLETDITISLGEVDEMAAKARERIESGFTTLKIKVGGDVDDDIGRLIAIWEAVGDTVRLRLDANQGWTPKEAVYVGRELEKAGVGVELMEQPVAAGDIEGLRFVREQLPMPVYADESCFTPEDALRLVRMGTVDGINIKLMKCGGIYNARKIVAIAEAAHIPCMIGSMMENSISVTAAAQFAASQSVITSYDLDAPLFCSISPAPGGLIYNGAAIELPDGPGLGIETPAAQVLRE